MKSKVQLFCVCLFALLVVVSCTNSSTYIVTFKVDGEEDIVETYQWGDRIIVPEVEAKDDYVFIGWDAQIPEFMPERNLEFTAIFEKTKHTITYQIAGMEDIVVKYETGEKVIKPDDPVIEGYTFHGWDSEIPEIMPDKDVAIQALVTKNKYTITYQIENMEDLIVTYEFGETVVAPVIDVKLGSTLEGWEPSLPEVMPAENLVVKAIISTQKYVITYQIEGMEDIVVLYAKGVAIVAPNEPIKEGYTFNGWDPEIPEVMPENDLVFQAVFTKNVYTITFKVEGMEDQLIAFAYGEKIVLPTISVQEGYELIGWVEEVPETMPAKNLIFNAVLEKKMYTITYKGIGVDDIVVEYEFGAQITLPEPHYRNGFIFSNWVEELPEHMPAKHLVVNAKYTMDPDYEGVLFIGHAGCYSGIMNTETAFINAAVEKGYQAIECDLKQTKDGVFVVCHDDTFNGVAIASTNYEDLKDITYTTTRGGISYTSTICTLERYLEICKEYDLYAVIELKWSAGINNNDQSRMPALMSEIAKKDMTNQVIFLASQYKCLEWVRNNGYDNIQCQYLVNSADSETVYNRCVEWNFDVSFNIASTNTKEWIDRYHDAGLKVSSYTFNQYQDAATLQKWIDLGVDYVTCDKLVERDVVLPDYSEIGKLPRYTVLFVDADGTILKETLVREGYSAAAPLNPTKTGYIFTGWDKAYNHITTDLTVYATYTLAEYKITYQDNLILMNETSWLSKQEFIDEFYEDWFNWLTSSVGIVPGLTKSEDTYTLIAGTGSNTTATFASVADLKALNVYVVEKTIGAFVYQPIGGTNSEDYVFEENNGYFLQTEPYRSKYKDLNRYFLNVIEKAYTGYSKNYAQASQGRVQIFFRFHQWQQGVSIPSFDTLPKKFDVTILDGVNPTMPTIHLSYTFEESFVLEEAVCEGYRFVGWYLDQDCSENKKVTSIEKGTTGDLILFAKWEKVE